MDFHKHVKSWQQSCYKSAWQVITNIITLKTSHVAQSPLQHAPLKQQNAAAGKINHNHQAILYHYLLGCLE